MDCDRTYCALDARDCGAARSALLAATLIIPALYMADGESERFGLLVLLARGAHMVNKTIQLTLGVGFLVGIVKSRTEVC